MPCSSKPSQQLNKNCAFKYNAHISPHAQIIIFLMKIPILKVNIVPVA